MSHLDFAQKIRATDAAVSASMLKNVGYLYIQRLYYQLEIDKFFNNITKDRKITFNPDLVNRFMTYSRILAPDSKLGNFEKLNTFYEEPVFDYQHIMRTMDLMHEHYNEYIEYLFKASGKIHKRNTAVCYYDCTNFYCEAESQDPDYIDDVTGEVFTGLRQYGFSKDHKPNPLVEMGLFMDANGIPISMCIAPGNTNEQTTVIPLEKELIKMFGSGKNKFIYCADAGLSSYHIRNFNSMGGRAFVVTQSVKKLSDVLKQAVFNDCDYRLLSDDSLVSIETMKTFDKKDEKNRLLYQDKAYKVIEANTLLDVGLYEEKVLNNGKTKKVKSKATLKQHVIIT
ncbi:MAG TPA: transposase, partial [Ruminiclostridium sp.]|nr:transposase [Ruminiclostridium sp.]